MKKVYATFGFIFLAIALPAKADRHNYEEVRVLRVTPNYATVQQQVCKEVYVERPGQQGGPDGGAIVLGAIVGNAIGGASGIGDGRTLGTVIGGIAGAEISKKDPTPSQVVKRTYCEWQPVTVPQGETVTFSYRGQVFTHTFKNLK